MYDSGCTFVAALVELKNVILKNAINDKKSNYVKNICFE